MTAQRGQFVKFHPGPYRVTRRKFDPAGFCIYCGATSGKLTNEHIIPAGIFGRLEFPEASCLKCNAATSSRESHFQNQTIPDFKTAIRAPTRSGTPLRGKIRFLVDDGGLIRTETVPASSFPYLLALPHLAEYPEMLIGEKWAKTPMLYVTSPNHSAAENIRRKYGRFGSEIRIDVVSFFLMLAKMAHSYAIATKRNELNDADLLLPEMIKNGTSRPPTHVVGGDSIIDPPSGQMHEIGAYITSTTRNSFDKYLSVRIRLFAPLGTPTYTVLVAKLKPRPEDGPPPQ